jgi:hypothetical protein
MASSASRRPTCEAIKWSHKEPMVMASRLPAIASRATLMHASYSSLSLLLNETPLASRASRFFKTYLLFF